MQSFIPMFSALLVGITGVVSLLSALRPSLYSRIKVIQEVFPLEVIFTSRLVTIVSGLALIVVAQNLWAKKRRAWYLSLVLLIIVLIAHLAKGLDYEEAIFSLLPIFLLVRFQALFTVQSTRLSRITLLRQIVVMTIVISFYALVGYVFLQTQFTGDVTPLAFENDYLYSVSGIGKNVLLPQSRWAHWFENSLAFLSSISVLWIVYSLFAPLLDRATPTEEERARVHALSRHSQNGVAYFANMGDKQYYSPSLNGQIVAYRVTRGVAVALGEPLGPGNSEETMKQFDQAMKQRGLLTTYYNCSENVALRSQNNGYAVIKIGEEAIINLDSFSLDGAKIADVRHGVSRMRKEQVAYQWYSAADIPWSALNQLDQLHAQWLSQKNMPPMTFSLEYYPLPPTADVKILLVKSFNREILAALSFLPYEEGQGVMLDLMLRTKNAKSGLMEAAICEACTHFRELGVRYVNLSLAPLSHAAPKIMERLFERLSYFYQFKSLYKFKDKFDPIWKPKYLIVQKKMDLPKVALSLLAAHLGRR